MRHLCFCKGENYNDYLDFINNRKRFLYTKNFEEIRNYDDK